MLINSAVQSATSDGGSDRPMTAARRMLESKFKLLSVMVAPPGHRLSDGLVFGEMAADAYERTFAVSVS